MSDPPNPLHRDPSTDWVNGGPLLQFELDGLDGDLAAGVNGDGGGTYTMAGGTTEIAGAGVWLAASPYHQVSAGGRVHPATGKHIAHADNDHTLFGSAHIGRTRSILTSAAHARGVEKWALDSVSGSPQSKATGSELMLKLRVHDGARLLFATLRFHVGTNHNAPAALPKFRVLRVDPKGTGVPMTTNAGQGFVMAPRPTVPSDWYAGGGTRTIAVSCDDNVLDTSRYTYWAHVIDEAGTGAAAGNIYADVICDFDSVLDLRPQ